MKTYKPGTPGLSDRIIEVRHLGGCYFPLERPTPDAIDHIEAGDMVAVDADDLVLVMGRWQTGNLDGYTSDGRQVLIETANITGIFKQGTLVTD